MTASEALQLFREWADDQNAPYLWPDAAVWRYLTLAQQDAAARARLLREDAAAEALRREEDDTPPVICSIDLVAGQARYALSPLIVALADGPRVVTIGDRSLSRATGPNPAPARSGQPELYWDAVTELVVYPTPTAADVAAPVDLDVYRLPLADIVDETSVFEVPLPVQAGLVPGALALAYAMHDADTYDPAAAQRWEAEFTRWFGPRIEANVLRKQRDKRRRVVRCGW